MSGTEGGIAFGTSTWTYEGWRGLVYHRLYPKGRFKSDCLAEYAQHQYRGRPLFQTVGLDQTFYAPPTVEQLQHYAAQLPPGFEVCSKVWEEVTVPRFADHPRYGTRRGRPNPRFLDPRVFLDEVLPPYQTAFQSHTGPFIFEFQRGTFEIPDVLDRLDRFLAELPAAFRYAVEVRDAFALGERYRRLLERHGAAHVYNHWSWMPALMDQHAKLGAFTAPFTCLRLLTPLGMSYENAVKTASPYNRLVRPLPAMRRDAVRLIRHASQEQCRAYVLVNNRAEGCAPLTIQTLVDELTGSVGASPTTD